MLKSTENYFENKKKSLLQKSDKTRELKDYIRDFLKNKFGENINGIEFIINYDLKNNRLSIDSGNKIIANELVLCLEELTLFLKSKKITPTQVLIR